jgi:hypothetical protein
MEVPLLFICGEAVKRWIGALRAPIGEISLQQIENKAQSEEPRSKLRGIF